MNALFPQTEGEAPAEEGESVCPGGTPHAPTPTHTHTHTPITPCHPHHLKPGVAPSPTGGHGQGPRASPRLVPLSPKAAPGVAEAACQALPHAPGAPRLPGRIILFFCRLTRFLYFILYFSYFIITLFYWVCPRVRVCGVPSVPVLSVALAPSAPPPLGNNAAFSPTLTTH